MVVEAVRALRRRRDEATPSSSSSPSKALGSSGQGTARETKKALHSGAGQRGNAVPGTSQCRSPRKGTGGVSGEGRRRRVEFPPAYLANGGKHSGPDDARTLRGGRRRHRALGRFTRLGRFSKIARVTSERTSTKGPHERAVRKSSALTTTSAREPPRRGLRTSLIASPCTPIELERGRSMQQPSLGLSAPWEPSHFAWPFPTPHRRRQIRVSGPNRRRGGSKRVSVGSRFEALFSKAPASAGAGGEGRGEEGRNCGFFLQRINGSGRARSSFELQKSIGVVRPKEVPSPLRKRTGRE